MRYLTLFPEAENIHLIKDVGMIPYSLIKFCGYEATLACYDNGNYPYIKTEVPGLKLLFLKKIFNHTFWDTLIFIVKHHKKYDTVQTFHFRFRALLWLFIFKLLHPSGKTYLKLDANEQILKYAFTGLKGKIQAFLLRRIDMISVETTNLQNILKDKWKRDIAYIPNGYGNPASSILPYEQKINKIITVGRIGAPEKRSEVLLEAFALFSERQIGWTLELIGPVTNEFEIYIQNYFCAYPQLKEKISFTGAIHERKKLYSYYAEAKIFCLSSSWESFGIALVEAAAAGCYIITSAVAAAKDITYNEHYGSIFPVDDVACLANTLVTVSENEILLKNNYDNIQKYTQAKFSWAVIAKHINSIIKK